LNKKQTGVKKIKLIFKVFYVRLKLSLYAFVKGLKGVASVLSDDLSRIAVNDEQFVAFSYMLASQFYFEILKKKYGNNLDAVFKKFEKYANLALEQKEKGVM